MQKTAMALPSVFDYVELQRFLNDRIGALRELNPKFSYRWVAKKSGFKSLHHLSMIISGTRRIPRSRVAALAKTLKLDSKTERECFIILCELSLVRDQNDAQKLLHDLNVKYRNGLFEAVNTEGMGLFGQWYLPAIRELSAVDDYKGTAAWVASRLKITEEEAAEGLAELQKLGFLVADEHGVLRRQTSSVHNMSFFAPLVMARFHAQMLEQSLKALSLPRADRYNETLTLAIPDELFEEVRAMAKQFFREVDAFVESKGHRQSVYQLNMQFFRLSQRSR